MAYWPPQFGSHRSIDSPRRPDRPPQPSTMAAANPILIPELRVMLAEGDSSGLREVAEELHPATVADFTEGLDDREIWQVLDAVPVELQSEIFPYYPLGRQ